MGTESRGRQGTLPGRRRTWHLHGERDLLLRAHHVPQRGIEKHGGQERRGPPRRAPLRAQPGHAGLPPTRRRRRRERPRGAAPSGRWASALGCLLHAAPPASRAPGSLGEQKKERGGEGGEEEGEERGGEGGRRGRKQGDAPFAAAAARPRLGGSRSPAGRGGRAEGAARAETCKLQCPWPLLSAPYPTRPTAAAEFFTTPQSAAAGATLVLTPGWTPQPPAPSWLGGGAQAGG